MKSLTLSLAAIAGALLISSFVASEPNATLEIGAKAPMPDAQMDGIDGARHSLASLAGENGLAVVFSCNTCPFVVGGNGTEGWEGRYPAVHKEASKLGVGMVLVNSNTARRDAGDNLQDMRARAKDHGLKGIPYVLDEESKLADAFGAKTTPHVFLFNKNMELVYKGAIDDNVGNANEVKEHYLSNAMTALSNGKKIKKDSTRPIGCSIKRVK